MAASKQIDWAHVYLLGWYDETGKGYLSTWDGDLPYVYVVVTGVPAHRMPLWKAPIPTSSASLSLVPEEVTDLRQQIEYATSKGGYLAIAWYIADGFERTKPASASA